MGKCPYTWFKSMFSSTPNTGDKASHLRVTVSRGGTTSVDVTLPAGSAARLISLIPEDVMRTIRSEGIPIDDIQEDLCKNSTFFPQKIFTLDESDRNVQVWLE